MDWKEVKWYDEQVGYLYPYDLRHDAADAAYVSTLTDGRVRLRLKTEPIFTEAVLVYNDGAVHGEPMHLWAEDRRSRWWEVVIRPGQPRSSPTPLPCAPLTGGSFTSQRAA